jgi:hypothetical protein
MSNIQKLNNTHHLDLQVVNQYGSHLGDAQMFTLTFPGEMRSLQSTYPLLLWKPSDSSQYSPVALLGFEEGENLFLSATGWDQDPIPLMMQKGPFMIGQESKNSEVRLVVALDLDHPKVVATNGERLFFEHGGNSDYLERMTNILERIHLGLEHNQLFSEALEQADIVSPMNLNIQLEDGSQHELRGFFGIDEEKLQQLPEEKLNALHRGGFLLPIFMLIASQGQLRPLILRKNQARR